MAVHLTKTNDDIPRRWLFVRVPQNRIKPTMLWEPAFRSLDPILVGASNKHSGQAIVGDSRVRVLPSHASNECLALYRKP